MSEIISVCKIRTLLKLKCSDCVYYGKDCDRIKKRNGHKPYNSKLEKENETDGN